MQSTICSGDCVINTETECDSEMIEEETNIIKREAQYEVVPHRNKSKKSRKKINLKYQVRGKLVNLNNETQTIDPNVFPTKYGSKLKVHNQRIKFLCPVGFVPRKNRCGIIFTSRCNN